MRKQYRLDFSAATEELMEYLIANHSTEYQIFGPPNRHSFPDRPDFKLWIEMGDDVATHVEIFNKDKVKEDKKLQTLLAKCSKFKVAA